MKTLIDGTEITSRIYYYLLDYKDKNLELYTSIFGSKRLNELSIKEFKDLYEIAQREDFQYLTNLL